MIIGYYMAKVFMVTIVIGVGIERSDHFYGLYCRLSEGTCMDR